MMLLRYLWFVSLLILYPVRLAAYWLHSFLIFFTKPGALIILPTLVILAGALARYNAPEIFAPVEGVVQWFGEFFRALLGDPIALGYPGTITAVFAFIGLYVAIGLVAGVLHPIVHAFPPTRRPFLPLPPLHVPKHVIRVQPVRVVVKSPGRRFYSGRLADMQMRLPADIREVIARPYEPARPVPFENASTGTVSPEPPPSRPVMQEPAATPPRSSPGPAKVPGARRKVMTPPLPSREGT